MDTYQKTASILVLGVLGAAVSLTVLSEFTGLPGSNRVRSDTSPVERDPDRLKDQLADFRRFMADLAESAAPDATPLLPSPLPEVDPESSEPKGEYVPGNKTTIILPDGREALVDRLTGEIAGYDTRTPENEKRFGWDFDFRRSDYATYSLATLEELADGGDHIAMMYVASVRVREKNYDEARRLWLTSATISGQTRALANASSYFFGQRNFYDSFVFGALAVRLGDHHWRGVASSAEKLLSEEEALAARVEIEETFRAMEAERRSRTGHGF